MSLGLRLKIRGLVPVIWLGGSIPGAGVGESSIIGAGQSAWTMSRGYWSRMTGSLVTLSPAQVCDPNRELHPKPSRWVCSFPVAPQGGFAVFL